MSREDEVADKKDSVSRLTRFVRPTVFYLTFLFPPELFLLLKKCISQTINMHMRAHLWITLGRHLCQDLAHVWACPLQKADRTRTHWLMELLSWRTLHRSTSTRRPLRRYFSVLNSFQRRNPFVSPAAAPLYIEHFVHFICSLLLSA